MVSASGRPPTAEGSLEKTPLVHLLVYLADRALTGSMVFVSPRANGAQYDVVYFADGAPAKVRTGEPVAHLGEVLVEFGFLTEQARRATLATARQASELHGRVLVRTGAIDEKVLLTALCTQATRKLTHIFGVPNDTTFSFFEGTDLLEDWGGPELVVLDPLEQIWRAACARSNEAVVDSTLARLGLATLKLHDATAAGRFGFGPAELRLVDRIRQSPSTLADLIASGVAPERATRLVVYVLLVTRYLDVTGSIRPATNPPPVASIPVARANAPAGASAAQANRSPARTDRADLSPALAARRESILERAGSIDTEDYFQMLGVPRDAPDRSIQSAYYSLAKEWHTDRLPPELDDVRDAAAKVFARIDEAFQTLLSHDRRSRYIETLGENGGAEAEQEHVERILDAATQFQHGEVFFKQHDLANAEKCSSRAYELDPEQSDYIALHAAVQLQKRAPDAPVDDLLALVDEAISRNDRCERAYFCRGILRKRMGRIERAMDDFRVAFQLNPSNLDAGREVHVFEMRKAKQSGAPGKTKPPSKDPSAPPPKRTASVLSSIEKLFKR
jgi:tetratricopeptide (TPR) repeat protein